MSSELKIRLLAGIVVAMAGCADFRRGPYWEEETGAEGTEPPGTGDGGDGLSFAIEVYPLLQAGCERCHSPAGAANGTDFIVTDDVTATYDSTMRFVDVADPPSSRLLSKAAGMGHTGGVIYDERSAEYQTILQWIEEGASP